MVKNLIRILPFFLFAFASCSTEKGKENGKTEEEKRAEKEAEQLKTGRLIVNETFTALSTTLQKKIEEGGVQNAVEFCKLSAYPLTDSLAQKHGVTIKRTSLQFRNPNNKPSGIEKEWLEKFASWKDEGKDLTDTLVLIDNQYHYFKPILLMENCRQCHGKPGIHIAEEDYTFIQEKYPNDRAFNFNTDDLRGMWVVTF